MSDTDIDIETVFDMSDDSLREVNSALHSAVSGSFRIVNVRGAHAVAAGINSEISVEIDGSVAISVSMATPVPGSQRT